MLFKRIVPEEAAIGDGYLACASTSGVRSGTIVKLNGVWTSAEALATAQPNKPGWATANAKKWSLMDYTDSAIGTPETYIIKKYEFQREDSDLSLDAIRSGEGCVAYNQGWFETDCYNTDITSSMAVGTYLYVTGGQLCSGNSTNRPKRAQFWGMKSSYDTNYYAQAPIYVRILPVAIGISGWA